MQTDQGLTQNDIYFEWSGERDKPVLVLLHSGGMSSAEWQPFTRSLSEKHRLLRLDLPGHGQSKPIALSVKLYAEQVSIAIDQLVDEQYSLLGSSLGGAVSLTLACTQPNNLEKLIIYRMGYRKSAGASRETQNMADPEYWRRYGLDGWLRKIHTAQTEFLQNTDSSITTDNAWEHVIGTVETLMSAHTTDFAHTLEDLTTITVPTLLICGDRDPVAPLSDIIDMHQALPNSALWLLPNTTHITAANTWRRAAFVEEVTRFLAS